MRKHCDYRIIQIDCDRVFVVDLDCGNKSVTNDAEYVLEYIHNKYPGKRLIYRDSDGVWGEITGNKKRAGFKDYQEYIPK